MKYTFVILCVRLIKILIMTNTNNIRIIKYEVGQQIKDHSDVG